MYKIIFIDIDGTLRNDQKKTTERTKNAIHKVIEKGIYVVICSGRPGEYVEEVSKEALASSIIISCNGGEIYDYRKKETICMHDLEKEEVIKLWNLAEKYDTQIIIISNGKRFVRKQTDDQTDIFLEQPIEKFVMDHPITQCVFSSLELERIQNIKEEINDVKHIEVVNLSKCLVDDKLPKEKPFFLDITRNGTSKGKAIKKLCEYLKINLKDSIAIGDSFNDLTMFETVGHSVVMGNAPDEIKKMVNEVTDTNNEDGVAKFLEKLNKEGD